MKILSLILMAAVTATLNHSALAENAGRVMPPPGPYKSIDDQDQYAPEQNDLQSNENYSYVSAQPNQFNRDAPEWMRQRQAQMQQWQAQQSNRQPPAWNNQAPSWNYNQAPVMPNVYTGHASGVQENRFQPPYPSARGPVYGPGAVPPEFYQPPAYQGQRY